MNSFKKALLLIVGLSTLSIQSATANDLNYGDAIYLQNNAMDRRWLTGSRGGDGAEAITDNHLKNDVEQFDVAGTYKWIIQSTTDGQDSKAGQCIRYGEEFYLRVSSTATKYLDGAIGSDVYGSIPEDADVGAYDGGNTTHARWIARSNLGDGARSNSHDPAAGECIQDFSVVYLQNMARDGRWLTGSRGRIWTQQEKEEHNEKIIRDKIVEATASFFTRNKSSQVPYGTVIFTDDDVYLYTLNALLPTEEGGGELPTYEWIIKKERGNGLRDDRLMCSPIPSKSSGAWKPTTFSNAEQTISYTEGVEQSVINSESTEINDTWKNSVETSITAGFGLKGFSAEASVTVTGEFSNSLTDTVSSAVEKVTSEETTHTTKFNRAGQIWQFVYTLQDICQNGGNDGWTVNTKDIVITEGKHEPPCCLPGWFKDASVVHGQCALDSPSLCAEKFSTAVPTKSPSKGPTLESLIQPTMNSSNAPTTSRNVGVDKSASSVPPEPSSGTMPRNKIGTTSLVAVAIAIWL